MQNSSRPSGGDQLARLNRGCDFGGSVGPLGDGIRLSAPITEVIAGGGASPPLITTPGGWQHASMRTAPAANLPRSTATYVRPRNETWANRTGLEHPVMGIPVWDLQGRIAMRGIS